MKAIMVGCTPRETLRTEMISKLAIHKVFPILFLSPCDGKTLKIYENWHRALQYALNANGDALLFEDDGIVQPHFSDALAMARDLNQPCYFYINEVLQDGRDEEKHLYPSDVWQRILSGKPMPLQAVKLKNVSRINSALAVYMPKRFLNAFFQQYKTGNFDSQLCRWLDSEGIDTYTVIPHAVQHAAGKSFWNGGVTRSKSASAGLKVDT